MHRLKPTEWRTVQRNLLATRHAIRRGNKRTLCSGPGFAVMDVALTRNPPSVERLLCQVDCLTCMRQLLRILEVSDD